MLYISKSFTKRLIIFIMILPVVDDWISPSDDISLSIIIFLYLWNSIFFCMADIMFCTILYYLAFHRFMYDKYFLFQKIACNIIYSKAMKCLFDVMKKHTIIIKMRFKEFIMQAHTQNGSMVPSSWKFRFLSLVICLENLH